MTGRIHAIVFDLDGTLIDSAPGILASCEAAFKALNLTPCETPSASLIGPPLHWILERLLGRPDPTLLAALSAAFKSHYDTEGYKQSQAYPGIAQLLNDLKERDIALYVATNKRATPTASILHTLGWTARFQGAYSLDSVSPPLTRKGLLLKHLLAQERLNESTTLYVGDRDEDRVAAQEAALEFSMACWGYGEASIVRQASKTETEIARFWSDIAVRLPA